MYTKEASDLINEVCIIVFCPQATLTIFYGQRLLRHVEMVSDKKKKQPFSFYFYFFLLHA